MSRLLKEALAQHSAKPTDNDLTDTEAESLACECVRDLADVEKGFEDIARMEDLGDALTDIYDVANGLESATFDHLLLIEAGIRSAVAGSDVRSDEVMPGLENCLNETVTTEGLGETVLKMWEGTAKVLDKTWKKLESFYDKIYPSVSRILKQTTRLRDRAEETAGQELQIKSTEIGPEVNALAINYKAPKNEKDIQEALQLLQSQCGALFGRQVGKLAEVGENIAKALGDFDPENPEDSLEKVTDAAMGLDLKAVSDLIGAKSDKDKRFSDKSEVFKGPDLPGNKSVFLVRDSEVSDSALGRAEASRRRSATIRYTSDKDREVLKGATVTTVTPAGVLSVCSDIRSLCSIIEDHSTGKELEKAKQAQRSIREAISKTTAKVKRDDVSETAVAHWRSATSFASAYARWVTDPNTSLVSLSMAACRSAITIANKSLSNY